MWIGRRLDRARQDLRDAVRLLRKSPVFTLAAVLSLALGIGANTAIFSLVDSLLLRALPVAAPDRLVFLSTTADGRRGQAGEWTYAIWEQIQRHGALFDGACAFNTRRFNLAPGGETQPVDGMYASGDCFPTLGVSPRLGRMLTADDDRPGGGRDGQVAVISDGLWQRRFAGATGAIGASILIDHIPFTIVGVLPPQFFGMEVGRTVDVVLPLNAERAIRGSQSMLDVRNFQWLHILLRLRPGQSKDAAAIALRGVQRQISEGASPDRSTLRDPHAFLEDPFALLPAATGTSRLRQPYQRALLTILVVVALVLGIACANIANLLLARGVARRHELSVRLAIGASRGRLARQLLVESLVLASLGAIAGLLFAAWGSRALVAQLSTTVGRVSLDLSLDWRVLAFTAAVTIATVVMFGVAPALAATRVSPIDALKDQARAGSSGTRSRLVGSLVIAQVALSLVLVVGAGLFLRTFARLATLPLGFDRDRVLLANVNAVRVRIDPDARLDFYQRLVDAVSAVPGVAHAAASSVTPVSGGSMNAFVAVSGGARLPDAERNTLINFVTPGWFTTYGMPIRAGRDFSSHDTATAAPVVIVNEAFMRRFFPGRDPIGETVSYALLPPGHVPVQKAIVGVVGDAVYGALREDAQPAYFQPLAQWDFPAGPTDISIGVRAFAGSPVLLARGVAAAIAAVDGDAAFTFRPLADQVRASIARERIVALLAAFFGTLALLLAGLGLYGVTSYAVQRQRGEIGIRMALGAAPGRVVREMLARVSLLVGTGVVVGVAISAWLSRFAAPLLFGLEPRDPLTLVLAALTLAAVGAVAAWRPASRAARIDPASVLRAN